MCRNFSGQAKTLQQYVRNGGFAGVKIPNFSGKELDESKRNQPNYLLGMTTYFYFIVFLHKEIKVHLDILWVFSVQVKGILQEFQNVVLF